MTSNLIAYWRNENERQAQERAYLLDKYKTQMEERRLEREEKWRNLNYQLETLKARNQEQYYRNQLAISEGQLALSRLSIALETRRQQEVERSNATREAQAERERVTQSYLKQRELQERARQESAKLEMQRETNQLNTRFKVADLGTHLALSLIGYSLGRKTGGQ